ncbi:hypothetical protein R3P38DRAFT_2959222 [Favolaschia claudopus]|uniref:Uncharacterized protein n=1 Tax=Favolaschia claudopus TaxID=2862362 RepID=A0AAW0BDQ7_9AGAR
MFPISWLALLSLGHGFTITAISCTDAYQSGFLFNAGKSQGIGKILQSTTIEKRNLDWHGLVHEIAAIVLDEPMPKLQECKQGDWEN